ncbi:hypothetical protein KIV56_14210 [Cryobacterium breve]|jgi:predicted RNase H-like nuclease (RuvC/YqgF family)|uniref:DUF3618 domain-containing protein n=1 Tax=Cryobacterium breve TaxID=1259258 RepID=A0ABY7NB19_9MICO|nr:hypothetical protein [Cryobacterium breve]WBM79479.1 hypothetical protein KIV56_14210 [Cryobacterium breve]
MTSDPSPQSAEGTDLSSAAEIREARLEIRALRAELATVAPEIADLKRQITAARAQGERYRQQVEILRRSRSWQITRPLRLFTRRASNARR